MAKKNTHNSKNNENIKENNNTGVENKNNTKSQIDAEFKKLEDEKKVNNQQNTKQPKKPILTEQQLKKRKSRKTRVAVASFVLLIAVGVMGNWYYENSNLSNSIKPIIGTSDTKTLGEAKLVDGTTELTTESDYFSSARVDRQSARDKSLEKLQAVIDKTDSSQEANKEASEEIAKISNYISIENKIETLVTAKGINNCLAVINSDGTRVDVIVDTQDLNDKTVAQIKEIAMEQLNCSFENVSIIQSK